MLEVSDSSPVSDFKDKLEELNEELEKLNAEARELEEMIGRNVQKLLGSQVMPASRHGRNHSAATLSTITDWKTTR
jgi:hypothetical protein